jgi:hypothetical protein
MTVTIAASVPEPFVHLDNRALVLCNGTRAVGFALGSAGRWLEETFMIILDERRATRAQGERVIGGFLSEDGQTVTLYGGDREDLLAVTLPVAEFEALQQALTDIVHQAPRGH